MSVLHIAHTCILSTCMYLSAWYAHVRQCVNVCLAQSTISQCEMVRCLEPHTKTLINQVEHMVGTSALDQDELPCILENHIAGGSQAVDKLLAVLMCLTELLSNVCI